MSGLFLMALSVWSCNKIEAKKLAGTYNGIYSSETITWTGHTDTSFAASFIVSENTDVLLIFNVNEAPNHFNKIWNVPLDGVRDGQKYSAGDPYHKSVQFKGDSLFYNASVVIDGNSGIYSFMGIKQ